jgi:hypothetical protein
MNIDPPDLTPTTPTVPAKLENIHHDLLVVKMELYREKKLTVGAPGQEPDLLLVLVFLHPAASLLKRHPIVHNESLHHLFLRFPPTLEFPDELALALEVREHTFVPEYNLLGIVVTFGPPEPPQTPHIIIDIKYITYTGEFLENRKGGRGRPRWHDPPLMKVLDTYLGRCDPLKQRKGIPTLT